MRSHFEVFLRRHERRVKFFSLTCGPEDEKRAQVAIDFPEKVLLMPAEAAIEYEECGRSAKRYAARFPNDADAGRALFGYVRSESQLLSKLLSAAEHKELLRLVRRHRRGRHLRSQHPKSSRHIGTPTLGYGYESGDPYAAFLPPAVRIDDDTPEDELRAVVFIVSTTKKGTSRSGQEYESPLLVLTGAEYAAAPFQFLHDRLCTALRGARPRLVLEVFGTDDSARCIYEDGSTAPGPTIPSDDETDESG